MKKNTRLIPALLIALISFILTVQSQAAVVLIADDSGAGTLRQAILDATAGETITFDGALNGQTIFLSTGEMAISTTMTIDASSLTNRLTLSGNNASRIFNISSSGNLQLNSLDLKNGSSTGAGGAILNVSGTLHADQCTFSENFSQTYGGAISAWNSALTAVTNSTFFANTGLQEGGAIQSVNGSALILEQCTLTTNVAGSKGGALFLGSGTFDAVYCTIVENSSSNEAGGIFIGGPMTANIDRTILVNNTAPSGGDFIGSFFGSENFLTFDPLLAPLGDHGGPTPTMPPLYGSPVIDAIDDYSFSLSDQRGASRSLGNLDIGAVESQSMVIYPFNSGNKTLRNAIEWAPPGETITFAYEKMNIVLTSGQLLIDKDLSIDASTVGGVTIDGNAASRLFEFSSDTTNILTQLHLINGSADDGGAIFLHNGGALTVNDSSFQGNMARDGAGIRNNGAMLEVNNSTFANNSAQWGGSGIWSSGTTELNNSTLSGNTSGFGTLYSDSVLILNHCTVTENNRGVRNNNTLYSTNSIIAGNPSADIDGTGTINGINNMISEFPKLAPLGNYGGPTLTMPPLPGSLAIDAGGSTTLPSDQRGFSRLAGGALDIGAVEWNSSTTPIIVDTLLDEDDGVTNNAVSLRDAIAFSVPFPSSTITFDAGLGGGSIVLLNGELDIAHSVNIDASALLGGITLDGNAANRIFNFTSPAVCTISALTLTNGSQSLGGAIRTSTANLTVNACTLSGNSAVYGGAIFSETSSDFTSTKTIVINSTIVANTAINTGGGIENGNGLTQLIHCTITGNTAPPGKGSGVASYGDSFTQTRIRDSIITENSNSDVDPSSGALNSFTSSGYNLIGTGESTAAFIQIGDLTNAVAQLAPLGHYGGPTPTMPPLPGSPVIDIGGSATVRHDQRGYLRNSQAYNWMNDFSADLAGATVLTNSDASPATGIINAGNLLLTPAEQGQEASLVIPAPAAFSGFSASFDFFYSKNGASFVADGFSFSFGPEPIEPVLESGLNGGHQVSFKTWNPGEENSIISYTRKDGNDTNITSAATYNLSDYADQWNTLTVELTHEGLTAAINGDIVLENIDTGYSWTAGDTFTLAARTGGAYSEQRIDNINIQIDPPDIGAVEYQGTFELAQLWSMDWDGDGNPFGVEYALGTDPLAADGTNGLNLVALPSGGVTFGYNPAANSSAAWVLKRSLDLVSDPFVEVYRFDGPSGIISASIPYSVNAIGASVEVLDQTTPQPTNAFYQLEIELVP